MFCTRFKVTLSIIQFNADLKNESRAKTSKSIEILCFLGLKMKYQISMYHNVSRIIISFFTGLGMFLYQTKLLSFTLVWNLWVSRLTGNSEGHKKQGLVDLNILNQALYLLTCLISV